MGIPLMIAGAAVGAIGKYQQGQYQGALDDQNAVLANQQADTSRRLGGIAEERQLARVRGILGKQRAGIGAANVDPNSGTAARLQADTAQFGTQDALTMRANAYREAYGYDVQAGQYKGNGKQARRAGTMQAVSSLLTGGSEAYGQWKAAA